MILDGQRKLELFKPSFDSELQDVILELEHLRRVRLAGTTPSFIFFQLKSLFHTLESLGSARIEGNRTTLSEYIEGTRTERIKDSEQIREVQNLSKALSYIDETINPNSDITSFFIREIQQIAVANLTNEGDPNAGSFRNCTVMISGSKHTPPSPTLVQELMVDLIDFINRKDPPKYDLIKVALVHHRFGWIHPFTNGNGRTVRLLTYAMLLKYGFNVNTAGRIINPTAVFCNDRNKYYEMLSEADTGTHEGIEKWCLYVLKGILEERNKLDVFMDYDALSTKILIPSIVTAYDRGLLNFEEAEILKIVVRHKNITASTLSNELNIKGASYRISKLKDSGLIAPIEKGKRQYCIQFNSSKLIYGIIDVLHKNHLIPESLLKN